MGNSLIEKSGTSDSHTLSLPLVSPSLRLKTKTKPTEFPVLWTGLCCYTVKCSEILAHIKLLYNPRVNKVFTIHNSQRSFFQCLVPKGAPVKHGFQNFASPPFPLCVINTTTDSKSHPNHEVKIYTSR